MDKPTKAGCCTDHESESGCRNNYFDGKRLTTDSFRVEQRYLLGRRQVFKRLARGQQVFTDRPNLDRFELLCLGQALAVQVAV